MKDSIVVRNRKGEEVIVRFPARHIFDNFVSEYELDRDGSTVAVAYDDVRTWLLDWTPGSVEADYFSLNTFDDEIALCKAVTAFYSATYYGAPREDFFLRKAFEKAREESKERPAFAGSVVVFVEDLS